MTALTTAVLLLGVWLSAQDRADRPGVIPRSADEIPADEGVIRGRVVDARSRRPIAGATIAVVYDGPAVATSGQDGRYEIAGVAPGDIEVFVRADGYVASQYGQRQPTDLGATVPVRGGQATTGVNVELQRVGSMSGRIYDASGEGLAGVEVQMLTERYGPGGPPMWGPVGFAQTDASGLFQIPDVTPGEHRVQAYRGRGPRSAGTDEGGMYVPTFFPSTTRLEEALSLRVAPGQEMFGVDFELLVRDPLTIAGIVTGPTGEPLGGAQIAMVPLAPVYVPSLFGPPQRVADDGRFILTDVAPGAYVLRAEHARHPAVMHPVVVDDHVADVELVFREGTRLSGRILRDGGRPVPFDTSRLRVQLSQPLPGSTSPRLSSSGGGRVRSDETFSIDVVGPTQLQISNLPAGWALKMVRLDGVDITDEAIDFGNGVGRELELILTDQITHVVGRVADRRGSPVARYTVVVFPSKTERWGSARYVQGVGPDHDGVYHLRSLPPGDYLAVAVDALRQNAWFDVRVLEQLWSRATSFRLGDGEYQTLNLQLSTRPINLLNAR